MTGATARRLLDGATAGFGVAAAGLVAMLAVLALPGGAEAIAAIGGLAPAGPSPALRWAAAADTLLPLGYAAGFALMAAGLAPGQGAAAGAAIALTVLGLAADLAENGLVLAGRPLPLLTTLKFGALGVAGFVLVTMLPGTTWLQRGARLAGWVLTPLLLAALAAGFGAAARPLTFVLSLLAVFAVLGLAARQARP